MSALSIRLPESLHRNAKVYAAQEGISVNQLISPRWQKSCLPWPPRTIWSSAPPEEAVPTSRQRWPRCRMWNPRPMTASKAGFKALRRRVLAQVPVFSSFPISDSRS